MRSDWRFLNTGSYSGAMNMALDDVLLKGVQDGGTPVVRFYTWDPPAISFGYAQDPYNEVDIDRCVEAGIDLVRRPTGGRAVLHWEELTYSVVAPLNDSVSWGRRIDEAYKVIGKCLVEGLQKYGIDAELEKGQVDIGRRPRGKTATPCFSSIARSEVKLKGRKLIGSAQRRFSDAMLQHGSIIIGDEHERLIDLLLLGEHERLEWKKELNNKSISLSDCVENEVDQCHLIDCLFAGFSQQFNCSVCVENASDDEWGHASDRMNSWCISPSLDRLAR
ncbi:MAG: lipoate--protein ligase family protein [Candidatus Latescibacterota bacterium]|nr:lipoate--protein ligase family protein [Candidatus Latescibacterota bacterium]